MKKSRRQLGYPANWSKSQRFRIRECIAKGDTIAYWCSDAHGRPCNGGSNEGFWQAKPGLIQAISGQCKICGNALHATFEPHRWKGNRVWVVALSGQVEKRNDKLGASVREFLGEVLPEEAMSPSVGVRLGRKDLSGASLSGAYLSGVNLVRANLTRADLSVADLFKANLPGANLSGARLPGANLFGADLFRANLPGANLSGADLSGADLSGADLFRANLHGANLHGANLSGADLFRADSFRANLSGANLSGSSRYSDDPKIDGWKLVNGYLQKE